MPVKVERKGGRRSDDLGATVEAPQFAVQWLDRVYDPDDETLVLAIGDTPRLVADVLAEVPGLDLGRARRAHRRGVVTMSGENDLAASVSVTSFWDRFCYWMMLEGWRVIPPEARADFAEGYIDLGMETVGKAVADLAAGRPLSTPTGNDCFVLREEAEGIVRTAESLFVRPCMCRRVYQCCDKPVDVCILIDDDDRGACMEMSRERALELLAEAEHAGLTFTANDPQAGQAVWICCCADCCQPIIASERLGAADIWPRRRYLPVLDTDRCTRCRACIKRCPFGTLSMEGKGKDAVLRLDQAERRGCGVCSTGCADDAIAMAARV